MSKNKILLGGLLLGLITKAAFGFNQPTINMHMPQIPAPTVQTGPPLTQANTGNQLLPKTANSTPAANQNNTVTSTANNDTANPQNNTWWTMQNPNKTEPTQNDSNQTTTNNTTDNNTTNNNANVTMPPPITATLNPNPNLTTEEKETQAKQSEQNNNIFGTVMDANKPNQQNSSIYH